MEITKNDFIAVYDPTEQENLKLCLVQETPGPGDSELQVIFLRKVSKDYAFEVGDVGLARMRYVMGVTEDFQMATQGEKGVDYEEELDGLEIFFQGDKRKFRKWLKDQSKEVQERIENDIEEEQSETMKNKGRRLMKLVGRKDDSEVRRKIKISKQATVVIETKAQRKKKTKAKRARKPKPEKFRRGKNNPLIKSIVPGSVQMDSDSDRVNSECCTMCTNKELIRAVTRDRRKLFDAIFKKKEVISCLIHTQGVNTIENAFSIALNSPNPYYFERLMGIVHNEKKSFENMKCYTPPKEYRINVVTTGSNDKYAYGVKTREVQVGRGNRQGNNALLEDSIEEPDESTDIYGWNSLSKILTRLRRTPFVHEMAIKNEEFQSFLKDNFCSIVECGNIEIAAFVAKIVTKYGGYGFSNNHLLALVLDFDPVPVVEEEKQRRAKLKAEAKLKAAGTGGNHPKLDFREYKPRDAYTETGAHVALKFEDEFLTRDEMVQLLMKLRKANVTKKAYGNKQITPLHCACINPNPHALRYFIKIGNDLSVYDEDLRKPVHYAACSSSPENLKVLIERGVDLRDSDKYKQTPLMYAAKHGRLENVKLILDSVDIDLDKKCRHAQGAIHFAARGGHFDVVKYLVDKGASIKVTGPNRQSVISLASEIGNYQMVSYLLEKGASQIKSDKYGKSPLIYAVQNGHLKIANLLLKNGALYDKPDSSGNTPFHFAAAYGFYEMIDLLVRAGADVNQVNSWNLTPITIALLKNHFRCVKEFLKQEQINVNCQDNNGFTLVMHAINLFTPQSLEFAEYLLSENGADIGVKTYAGNNAFHNFAMNFSYRNVQISQSTYPAKHAKARKVAEELYTKFFHLLISHGADPNEKNMGGFTPLSICLSNGNAFFLKLLSENPDLKVDHVVKDKSELHYLAEIIMNEDAPEMLEKLLAKTTDFGLLMQLYDLDTGFNIFHSILDRVVEKYFSYLENKRTTRLREYNDTEYLLNILKKESQTFRTQPRAGVVSGKSIIKQEEDLLKDLEEAEKKAERAQRKSESTPNKKTLVAYLEKKLETVEEKYIHVYMWREEERLQARLEQVFEAFASRGYDMSQRVRLYKRKIDDSSSGRRRHSYNSQRYHYTDPNSDAHFGRWKNKAYKVNRSAKDSVFHMIAEKPNLFLFRYFETQLGWESNILNFRGESLIHKMLKNFNAGSPNMDVNIHNKSYDILADLETKAKQMSSMKNREQAEGIEEEEENSLNHSGTSELNERRVWPGIDGLKKNEKMQLIAELIRKGEDLNLGDKSGNLPIIRVAEKGGNDLFHLFVQSGTNINVIDRNGVNPFLMFAKRRDLKSCEYLLANKADIQTTDPLGRNALHWSLNNTNSSSSSNFDFEEFLIQSGVKVNQKDQRGLSPINYLFTKIESKFIRRQIDPIEIFSYLLSLKSISLEEEDTFGNRLLHYAAQRGAYLCALYLLRAKVQVNVYCKMGNTPFNISLQNSHNDVAILLLQHNAKVNDLVYAVDYDAWQRHRDEKRRLKNEENRETQASTIEEEEEDDQGSENEEISQPLELEDGEGLVEQAVIERFKEDEESESEKQWDATQVAKQATWKRPGRGKKRGGGDQPEFSESELDGGEPQGTNEKHRIFVIKVSSQFKVALENSMLSVNFLLVDFGFELGQAVMDAFSLRKFDYAKTLLKKKVLAKRFKFSDSKGRDLVHYLAFFGANASTTEMNFFFQAINKLGLPMNLPDCLKRQPAHYAALKGHLRFIEHLHNSKIPLHTKDVFNNNLLSLSLRNRSIHADTISTFVNDYSNDVNSVFIVPSDDSIEQIKKFELIELSRGDMNKQIKNVMKLSQKGDVWGWNDEMTAREGKTVRDQNKPGCKKWSIFMYVALQKKDMESLQGLIDLGVDLNSVDMQGRSLIAHAIKNNDVKLMDLLMIHEDKIDFGVLDNTKASYLHMVVNPYFSASYRNMKMLEFLLPRVETSLRDNTNRTALSYAQSHEDQTMANAILANGSKRQKIERESKDTLVSLPSSVIHAETDLVKSKFDFKKDALTYINKADAAEKRKGIEEDMDWEEKVERGLMPRADARVESKMRVVQVDNSDGFWNVHLVKVDIKYSRWSKNLFYKMQLLQDVHKELYIVFTNWGRIGTGGQYQQTPFFRLEDGQKEFSKIFKEKTKNEFGDLENFEKKRRKYNLVHLNLRPKASKILEPFDLQSNKKPASGLMPQIQELMCTLSNINMFESAYSSFNVEASYLPFDRLNKSVLVKAHGLLLNVRSLLEKADQTFQASEMNSRMQIHEEISKLSSDYYELIPCSGFKETVVPALDSWSVAKAITVVVNLLEFEVVSKMLCAANLRRRVMHPCDYIYQSIGTRISLVESRSEEAQLIRLAINHRYKNRNLQSIYAVGRQEDADRFKSLGNRRMLWHGAKNENMIKILHKGLRRRPACGDSNESQFGNGIYFDDNFGSALKNCGNHSSSDCDSVFILLCEVSLGRMQRLYEPQELKKPGSGYDSVKGSGRSSHPKTQHLYLNNGCRLSIGQQSSKKDRAKQTASLVDVMKSAVGVGVGAGEKRVKLRRSKKRQGLINWNQMGKALIGLQDEKKRGSRAMPKEYKLYHNQFVVYSPNQVKIRYLIKFRNN